MKRLGLYTPDSHEKCHRAGVLIRRERRDSSSPAIGMLNRYEPFRFPSVGSLSVGASCRSNDLRVRQKPDEGAGRGSAPFLQGGS